MKTPNLVVEGSSFLAMYLPLVYHWRRGNESLCIGISEYGWQRLLSSHKVVNRRSVETSDTIEIHYCETKEQALELETILSNHYKPKYNTNKGGRKPRRPDFRNSSFYR